ncbi:MAG: ATP-binding cassette domain-containing protein, partial [Dehalococcoidia bacterium]|nr:ATP-binding cassette domain-containing protein [Dehalococcoidia bacterium]
MSLQGVTVELGGYKALNDVTFDVEAGTLMGVVGPNGAGKSTLFNAIAGLLPVRRGRVTLDGVDLRSGALAYVPQHDSVNWRFPVTVQEVVMMGRCCRLGLFRRPGKR